MTEPTQRQALYSSGTIAASDTRIAILRACAIRTLDLATLNIIADILRTPTIYLTSHTKSRAQNLLDSALQFLREALESHRPRNLDDLVKGDRFGMLDVLLLLAVARWFLESFDDKR